MTYRRYGDVVLIGHFDSNVSAATSLRCAIRLKGRLLEMAG